MDISSPLWKTVFYGDAQTRSAQAAVWKFTLTLSYRRLQINHLHPALQLSLLHSPLQLGGSISLTLLLDHKDLPFFNFYLDHSIICFDLVFTLLLVENDLFQCFSKLNSVLIWETTRKRLHGASVVLIKIV